jgi:isopentenyl-diphosphate delta-isomerase
LAFKSIVRENDGRFYYEPLFAPHPNADLLPRSFLGKELKARIWISSMTGGTSEASTINRNLAMAAGEFGLGMGLGSCRIILDDDQYLSDFQLRGLLGDQPLYANLGIAQVEELFENNREGRIVELVKKTEADGLILHVNPLQEWLQPEGDRFKRPALESIKRCLDLDLNLIVKEVGQGFGPESLGTLMQLPLKAIDFAAHGGTNFSKLEMNRQNDVETEAYDSISNWGHSAEEMVLFYNQIADQMGNANRDCDIIISGGIRNFTDGYYLTEKINANAVYGQASAFLKHARGGYDKLREFVHFQIEGLKLARAYLRIRE